MPLIRFELPYLYSWIEGCPPSGVQGVRFIIAVDTIWKDKEKQKIYEVFSRSILHTENWRLEFLDSGLSEEESFYIKDSSVPINLDKFPYGQKSGPNKQFFNTLKIIAKKYKEGAAMLVETDAFPIIDSWLANLNSAVCDMDDKLLIGANYQGTSSLSEQIKDHINGNAIYNVANYKFCELLEAWEDLLLKGNRIVPFLAYDIVIPWYVNYSHINIKVREIGAKEIINEAYATRSIFLNQFLINYGGPNENLSSYKFDCNEFKNNFPFATIVHGKCFFASIYKLRLLYTTHNKFTYPLNIAFELLAEKNIVLPLMSGVLSPALAEILTRSIDNLTKSKISLIKTAIRNDE